MTNSEKQRVLAMASRCKAHTLEELYTTYSIQKRRAYEYCLKECANDNGYGFAVGNANTFGFTASWYFKDSDDREYLRVETKNNSYVIELG